MTALLFLVALFPATALQAQRTAADSLNERLRQAEAAIAALQTQVAEQAQGTARSRSGARIEFSGRVMLKAFGNSRRVNNVDNPQFVTPDPATGSGIPTRGVGMAIRESRLGVQVDVPDVMGGAFTGDVDVDFYGGQVPSSGGRTFPLVRLRTARGIVRWSNAELLIGQESPLVSGLNPMSLAAVGTPAFATAGNLWLWLPQVRAGAATSGAVRFGVQGAVLAPTSGDAATAPDPDEPVAHVQPLDEVRGDGPVPVRVSHLSVRVVARRPRIVAAQNPVDEDLAPDAHQAVRLIREQHLVQRPDRLVGPSVRAAAHASRRGTRQDEYQHASSGHPCDRGRAGREESVADHEFLPCGSVRL